MTPTRDFSAPQHSNETSSPQKRCLPSRKFPTHPRPLSNKKLTSTASLTQERRPHAVFLPLSMRYRPCSALPWPSEHTQDGRAPMPLSFLPTNKKICPQLPADRRLPLKSFERRMGGAGGRRKNFFKSFPPSPRLVSPLPFYSVPNSYCSSLSRTADRIMAMTPETVAAAAAGTSATSLFSRRRKNTEGHSCVLVLTRGST